MEYLIEEKNARIRHLEYSMSETNEIICQVLGLALAFPRYSDNPDLFPDAHEDGVCVGHFVAEDLARMAADKIKEQQNLLSGFAASQNKKEKE